MQEGEVCVCQKFDFIPSTVGRVLEGKCYNTFLFKEMSNERKDGDG